MDEDNINHILVSSCNIIINVKSYVSFIKLMKVNGIFKELNYTLFHSLGFSGKKVISSKLITTSVHINSKGDYDIRLPRNIMSLPFFSNLFRKYGSVCSVDNSIWDYRFRKNINLRANVGLREHQVECANQLNDHMEKPSIGSLIASTGLGKTFLSLNVICKHNLRTAVHFVAFGHLQNYKEEVLKFTDIKEDEIAIIKGEKSLHKDYSKCKIFLIMIQTMFTVFKKSLTTYGNSFDGSYDYFLIKQPKKEMLSSFYIKNKISCSIYDEAHRNTPSILSMLSVCNFRNVLFLTATHNRTQKKEDKILNKYAITYSVVHEEPNRHVVVQLFLSLDAISSDMTNYNKYKNRTVPGLTRSSINYFKLYDDLVRNGEPIENFSDLICTKIEALLDEIDIKKVAICLSMKIDHIKKLKTYVDKYFDYDCGLLIADNNKTLDYQLSRKIILSTEKFMNASLNVPDLESIILPFPNFHNPIMLKQILGRLRGHGNDRCIVVDIAFSDFIFRNHNNKRNDYYRNNSKELFDKEYHEDFDTSIL